VNDRCADRWDEWGLNDGFMFIDLERIADPPLYRSVPRPRDKSTIAHQQKLLTSPTAIA
jgi:hypothetical protein